MAAAAPSHCPAPDELLLPAVTGSGKTTRCKPCWRDQPAARLVIVEDSKELQCRTRMSCPCKPVRQRRIRRPSELKDLVVQALRMRPDRLALANARVGDTRFPRR
ncbi:ATPase, T2SS/T4P/T4SS family [Glutamicibacter nicotianae]|uniref:ATPase, T2SS/T4P/T4SS family n=1 Tax=Glutamicibacter nicotianae TaxID=37929 RepID=UPI003CD0B199